jgi:ABC-type multidrug transport system fused ATPase/permease subunit
VTVAAEGLVLWIGGHRVIDGSVGIGEVVTAVGLVLFLSGPLRTLGERVLTVQGALASARRIVEVLDAAAPADDDDRSDPVPGHAVSLEVGGITVGRPDDEPVVVGGDLTLRPGELVVLDGPTGGGKSTLLTALAGLRQPQAGELRLGGVAADEWPPDRWRRRVLLLEPVPFLFAGSVADNLTFADATATDDDIAAALTAAACDFVAELPDGLETVVGERGVTLSGGQRQRLALARAVLARPGVLLLDGATSALDDATERAVLEGLRTRLPATAIVVVTTNLHVRATADRVVELRDRRLVAP